MMVIQQDKYKYNVAFDFDPQSDSTLMVAKEPALRKGAEGVSTSGVTAISFQVFDGGTFWVLPLTYFYLPKGARAYLFPQSIRIRYFCSGPIRVDPICPQPKPAYPPNTACRRCFQTKRAKQNQPTVQ